MENSALEFYSQKLEKYADELTPMNSTRKQILGV